MEQFGIWQWSNQSALLTGGSSRSFYYFSKRCLDVTLSALLLIFLFPVILVIAILVKLGSPGPVFFTQERVGTRRRSRQKQVVWEVHNFRVYKFRSMTQNADQSIHEAYIKAFIEGEAKPAGPDGKMFKLTNDDRITPVGKILRKTSLDELPQLFNVLKGEMSLVGPRPVPTYEADQYQPWHHERLAALPGITGYWQVKGRCQVAFEDMIRMDIEYVRQQSIWLDLKLLILTLPAVIAGEGAE